MPITPDSDLYRCLYVAEDGEHDLFEVQLMGPTPDRLPTLHSALCDDDAYVVYQATLVLGAWADPAGLEQLERYIDDPVDLGVEPDRITGQENSLDHLAYALHLSRHNKNPTNEIQRLYRKLLRLYSGHFFKGFFASTLEKLADPELLEITVGALTATLPNDAYQASHLLPAIAKTDPKQGWNQAQRFLEHDRSAHNPLWSVAKALGYIDTIQSRQMLRTMASRTDRILSEYASEALAKLDLK